MYKVFYIVPSSPGELERWLNRMLVKNNWKLISVDNGYYIFEVQDDVIADDSA